MNTGTQEFAQPRHYARSPLSFLFLSLLCQIIAFAATLAALRSIRAGIASESGFWILFGGLLLFSTVAWLCSTLMALPPLWRVFNAVLLPLVIAAESLGLSATVYGAGIGLALLLYLPTLWTRVPYYPTSSAMFEAVASALPKNSPVRFVDLGCGFAGLLCFLARRHPESTFVGVELSPLAFAGSKLRGYLAGLKNVEIRFQSLWDVPLEDFDVAYAFLAPPPMEALWEKASEELPEGALFLVNSFPVPGVRAETIQVPGKRQVTLFLYRVAKNAR